MLTDHTSITMDFKLTNFDLPENIFFFHNGELEPLEFVLDSDTEDRFYFNVLEVSFVFFF